MVSFPAFSHFAIKVYTNSVILSLFYRITCKRLHWLEPLGIDKENYEPNKRDAVCSKHFNSSQIKIHKKICLVNDAAMPVFNEVSVRFFLCNKNMKHLKCTIDTHHMVCFIFCYRRMSIKTIKCYVQLICILVNSVLKFEFDETAK